MHIPILVLWLLLIAQPTQPSHQVSSLGLAYHLTTDSDPDDQTPDPSEAEPEVIYGVLYEDPKDANPPIDQVQYT